MPPDDVSCPSARSPCLRSPHLAPSLFPRRCTRPPIRKSIYCTHTTCIVWDADWDVDFYHSTDVVVCQTWFLPSRSSVMCPPPASKIDPRYLNSHELSAFISWIKLKQAVFEMFKYRKEGDMLMDAPEHKSWWELTTLAMDKKRWRARVRVLKQPRVTVDLTGHFVSESTFKCNW